MWGGAQVNANPMLFCSNADIYNSVIKPAVASTIDVVTDIFSRQSVRQRPMPLQCDLGKMELLVPNPAMRPKSQQ